MTQPAGAQTVCPFLGLPDDPASRFWLPDAAHRCWAAAGQPTKIDLAYQSARCMTDTYPDCVRFQARENPVPGTSEVMAAAAVTRPSQRARAGSSATQTRLTLLIGAIAVMVLLVAAVLMIGGFFGGKVPPVAATSPTPNPTITLGPTSTLLPTASPSPTLLATPTTSPGPSPSPTSTTAPTPSPTPVVHTVVKGETLGYIARLYGVTVDAIMAANGLTNANRIYIGQELLIPVQ